MSLAQDIRARLEAEEALDLDLSSSGCIHIERPQPFICLYRQSGDESDPGTQDLIAGQPSYLVYPYDAADYGEAAEALESAVETLSGMFGAVLVIELFALGLPKDYDPEQGPPQPRFEIIAPRRHAPVGTIEGLESALLEQSWPGGEPLIGVIHKHSRAPEDKVSLLPARLRQREDISDLALGVRAIYRDHERNAVLPRVLRDVRHSLTLALRRAFYEFSHCCAHYRPAHYHELGGQRIAEIVWDVDRAFADVGDSFDLILDSTPVNTSAAWSHFRSSHYEKAPEFHYRPLRHDPGTLKRQLYAVPLEKVEDPALHALFADKRDELDSQIDLLGSRGTHRFLYGSMQVYGAPDEHLLALSKEILDAIPPRAREKGGGGSLDAKAFAKLAQEELEYYRKDYPKLAARVEIREDVPGLIVSNGHFLIGKGAKVSTGRAAATIAHEVETHILTYYNGLAQPFRQLHIGLAGYEALQEGIAVLAEYLVGGLSRPRLRLLAGRVLAVAALVDGADFVETARMLHDDRGFSRRLSYMVSMRVYRSGGLTKDMVYLQGLEDLLKHLSQSEMPFEDLLIGKFALNHLEIVEELRWRKILKAPLLTPRYLSDDAAHKRLERLRAGVGPLDLFER